ncbi:mediator of RNA polymerase II transcription subunit 31 [Paracoccidioides lutzii Pb01]|uniref:Mediator of RNA polymerase II transcription subunit 31 n=1 Tax=Paracoccidioides lutzii (strain ATCC MYA-826 / Pb01) TaxID=502779 RepID=C1GU38_PARBA|nr:mediator of RNA polymerase II transcription subunit 31 [Paracoccidioides lutzii Pb01]EEH39844.1 mediator of RNA polymerase II transcription subunit 31 [Paracoccidioides lutzii Pb01]
MAQDNPLNPPIPSRENPRFTLELEFVLSLANPHYISHLAVAYPHLLGVSSSASASASASSRAVGADDSSPSTPTSDAQSFAAYLAYLYSYWKRPEYVQFLTHPGATLRALRLLQDESFRQAVIRPQVIEALLGFGPEKGGIAGVGAGAGEKEKEAQNEARVPGGPEGRNGIEI